MYGNRALCVNEHFTGSIQRQMPNNESSDDDALFLEGLPYFNEMEPLRMIWNQFDLVLWDER